MSASKKIGLGRGFSSLIPTDLIDETFDPTASQDERLSDLRNIEITKIIPDPDQPRKTFDDQQLEELAGSIKLYGVLQPIVVTPEGKIYKIVAGERRYRAAKLAGLKKIPALVRTLTSQKKLELSLIENLQRTDLNAIETATAYLKLKDQFNLNLDQIAQRVGKNSVSAVSNTLRLLKLPTIVKNDIVEGRLSEGQARPLIGLDENVLNTFYTRLVNENWSARKVEQFVLDLKKERVKKDEISKDVSTALYKDELARLKKRFNAPITITSNNKGAGKIVIRFSSDDEFKRIKSILDN